MTPSSHRIRIRTSSPPRPMYMTNLLFRVAGEPVGPRPPFQSLRRCTLMIGYYFTRSERAGFAWLFAAQPQIGPLTAAPRVPLFSFGKRLAAMKGLLKAARSAKPAEVAKKWHL